MSAYDSGYPQYPWQILHTASSYPLEKSLDQLLNAMFLRAHLRAIVSDMGFPGLCKLPLLMCRTRLSRRQKSASGVPLALQVTSGQVVKYLFVASFRATVLIMVAWGIDIFLERTALSSFIAWLSTQCLAMTMFLSKAFPHGLPSGFI